MRMNTTNTTPLMLQKGDIEDVSSFTYLGSTVSTTGGTGDDVRARIGKAKVTFNILQKIWKSRDITTSVKLQLFNSNVKSVLLYGPETWRTSKSMLRKVQAFINTCLRRMLRIRWPEKIRNEGLWERTVQEPVKSVISRRKWSWIGQTLRKLKDNITKHYGGIHQGSREVGGGRNILGEGEWKLRWRQSVTIDRSKVNRRHLGGGAVAAKITANVWEIVQISNLVTLLSIIQQSLTKIVSFNRY